MPNLNPNPETCEVALVPPWIWAVMTILQEARNQSFDGMLGVAEVIRNRTRSKFYSDGSVSSTVLKPFQFSGWSTNDPNRIICSNMRRDDPIVQRAIKAWNMANENNTGLTDNALYYHAKTMIKFPKWSSSPKIVRTTILGDHIFYKNAI